MKGKPRVNWCWLCGRKLWGNNYDILDNHGQDQIVHVTCNKEYERVGDAAFFASKFLKD